MPFLAGLFGVIGSVVTGIFGIKQNQAAVVKSALEGIGSIPQSDAQYAQSAADAINTVYSSGPLIERLWRPVLMWCLLGFVLARLFGFVPVGVSEAELAQVYAFLEIGLIGYIPLRTVEKLVKSFQIAGIIKSFVNKRVL